MIKLLLTSGGLKNPNLCEELLDMTNSEAANLTALYISTAANAEDEDKTWMIDNLVELKSIGFKKLDILDPSEDVKNYSLRLEAADILVFGGGDTEYLVHKLNKLSLDQKLRDWLEKKVIMGISAGSVMTGDVINPKMEAGLKWVDFLIVPHMNSPFVNRKREEVEAYASMTGKTVYWVDDNSAVRVEGQKITVVGEGKCEIVQP